MFQVLAIVLAGVLSWGSDLAPQARDLLINKFEKINRELAPNDVSRTNISLRLADLLSDRARYSSMKELETGCVECLAGEKDRRKALRLYKKVLPKLGSAQKAKVMSQVGHLYEVLGEKTKAISFYNEVIASKISKEDKSEAYLSLAEIYFKKNLFAKAINYYNQVLAVKTSKRRSLAAYRKAWALFNSGQVTAAESLIKKILNTPELLSRNGSESSVVDNQYKSEVSRDFATFLAKKGSGLSGAKELFQLSPVEVKIANVSYLANELERLGQTKSAIEVYRFVISQESDSAKRMSLLIRVAQLEQNSKNFSVAVEDYRQALSLWSASQCKAADCDELKSRLRKFVIDWHRIEKKKPSNLLVDSYRAYIEANPFEVDMQAWLVQAYTKNNKLENAYKVLDKISSVILSGKAVKGKNNKDKIMSLEDSLLQKVELAEKMGKDEFLVQAYNDYISSSQGKTKILEIKYQQAHRIYKKEDYKKASAMFRAIALETPKKPSSLQVKAADLALDSLAILKDNTTIASWAKDFAAKFNSKSVEYNQIRLKAQLNRVATLAEVNKDSEEAWQALALINVNELKTKEKITALKNRLILAEKLKKFPQAKEAANQLLDIKSLSPVDRQLALAKKAWFSELELNFKEALAATKKLKLPEVEPDKKVLKLALFSELAGEANNQYYSQFLKQTKDKEHAYGIALKLVKNAKQPVDELIKHERLLITKPDLYSKLYLSELLKLDAKKQIKYKKRYLANKKLAKTAAYKLVKKQNFFADYKKLDALLAKHEIKDSTQKLLSKTLSRRVHLLDRIDKKLRQAIKSGDWSKQVITLSLFVRESERFYSKVLSLPMPEGLSDQEQMQYMSLLSQQAAPYQLKAEQMKIKLKEFWASPELISNYQKSLESSSQEVARLIKSEMTLVKSVAPAEVAGSFDPLLAFEKPAPVEKIDFAANEKLRQEVRKNPLDLAKLKKLIEAEKPLGETAMLAYLQARLEQLEAISAKEAE